MDRQLETVTVPLSPMGLPDVISAIGNSAFEQMLLQYLYGFCGSDHIFTGHFTHGQLSNIIPTKLDGNASATQDLPRYLDNQIWRIDPLLNFCGVDGVLDAPLIHRQDSLELPRGDFRDVCLQEMRFRDRILICGREGQADSTLTLLLVKSVTQGPFSGCDVAGLTSMTDTLLAMLERHNWITQRRQEMGTALASIEDIERRCMLAARFPRREAEVCARIVSGLTTRVVARELQLGEQTVLTYRKRIYHRLQISSHRELVQWYLKLWSDYSQPVYSVVLN